MVCLPLPALHPLDSERPFFSTATKGEGSDCAGTFTGPLCFQMVLFSCDTLDTQHLPRIRTLLWGSTEGRWVVCRHEGTEGAKRQWRRDMKGPAGRKILEGWNLFYGNLDSATASSRFPFLCSESLENDACFIFFATPPPALTPVPHPVPYCSQPLPSPPALPALPRALRHSRCLIFSTSECLSSLTQQGLDCSAQSRLMLDS